MSNNHLQFCVYCGNAVLSEGYNPYPICFHCWEKMMSPKAKEAYDKYWEELNRMYSQEYETLSYTDTFDSKNFECYTSISGLTREEQN